MKMKRITPCADDDLSPFFFPSLSSSLSLSLSLLSSHLRHRSFFISGVADYAGRAATLARIHIYI